MKCDGRHHVGYRTRGACLMAMLVLLSGLPSASADELIDEEVPPRGAKLDGDKEAFLLKKREACGCGSEAGAFAVLACIVAIGAAKWLASETDYLSPSSFFTMTKDRRWKLPHEQYEEEQLATSDVHVGEDEVFRPES